MDRWTGPWRPSGSLGIGDSTWTFELWPDTPTELTFQFGNCRHGFNHVSIFRFLSTSNCECRMCGNWRHVHLNIHRIPLDLTSNRTWTTPRLVSAWSCAQEKSIFQDDVAYVSGLFVILRNLMQFFWWWFCRVMLCRMNLALYERNSRKLYPREKASQLKDAQDNIYHVFPNIYVLVHVSQSTRTTRAPVLHLSINFFREHHNRIGASFSFHFFIYKSLS